MFYRIKQFVWALTARMTEEEKTFVKDYLTDSEKKLFYKLKIYEQKHSIKVAKAMGEVAPIPKLQKEWIKLGLLHDIGKIVHPIGPIRKSIMVLLHKFTKGHISQVKLPMVKCYYQHPLLGYELLKKQKAYDKVFLQTILHHHDDQLEVDADALKALKKWDDRN